MADVTQRVSREHKRLHAPLESKTLVHRIADRIVGAVLSGEVPLGGKLREQALAQSLGVSRGPMREAIRRLEGRGLIERVANHGARVISLGADDLREIYTIREALEGIACRLATERMTPADLKRLSNLVEKQVAEVKKQKQPYALESDLDFHSRIVSAAGSKRLETLINDELFDMLRIYRARSEAVPGRGMRAVVEHQQVVKAMMAGDPSKAEEMMRLHIRAARDNLVSEIEKQNAAASA